MLLTSSAPSAPSALRLDVANQCLLKDNDRVALTPKAFALLQHLVENRHNLVTKAALLDAVWPGAVVEEGQVKQHIAELRRLLQDDSRNPSFIETVRGRGYRFIGPLELLPASSIAGASRRNASPSQVPRTLPSERSARFGRDQEFNCLAAALDKARAGELQACFVTGEAGIGKTTLVQAFLSASAASTDFWSLRGACSEQYGNGIPYLPILQAVEDFCATHVHDGSIALLRRHAPLWLLDMPEYLVPADAQELRDTTQSASQERRVREFVRFLRALTAQRVVIFWLEDLHWADDSTLAMLTYLARSPSLDRLMLIGTSRPLEMSFRNRQHCTTFTELMVREHCLEVPVAPLEQSAVTQYLKTRWPQASTEMAMTLHRHCGGNPLFMVKILDEMAAKGPLETNRTPSGGSSLPVPRSVRGMIEHQLEKLTLQEQHLLEAASVAGVSFSAASVAAALSLSVECVESQCEALARRHAFLRRNGTCESPDGAFGAQYEFQHALQHEAVYQRMAPSLRTRLHAAVATSMEQAYGHLVSDRAAVLAFHYEQARDWTRCLPHLVQAGRNSLQRGGYQETIHLLGKALEILMSSPRTLERDREELELQMLWCAADGCLRGFGSQEVVQRYRRAASLCAQFKDSPQSAFARWGIMNYHCLRGDLRGALKLGHELVEQCISSGDSLASAAAYVTLTLSSVYAGELDAALDYAQRGTAVYETGFRQTLILQTSRDPGSLYQAYASLARCMSGYPDDAVTRIEDALAGARKVSHPYTLELILYHRALLRQLRRESNLAQPLAEEAYAFADEYGFTLIGEAAAVIVGWAIAMQGQTAHGIAHIERALDRHKSSGANIVAWHLAMLAEAHVRNGTYRVAMDIIGKGLAFAQKSGERMGEAELYRIKGELLRKQGGPHHIEAQTCFRRAVKTAREQGAKWWELRATTSLAKLWRDQGKPEKAHALLAPIHTWFTEGAGTPDQVEAESLLHELAALADPKRSISGVAAS